MGSAFNIEIYPSEMFAGGSTLSQSLQNPGLDHCGIGSSVSLDAKKVNMGHIRDSVCV